MKSDRISEGRLLPKALATLCLLYAFFAGLRTVSDPDLGWHLSTARYILTHHQIPSTDVLSYTATGSAFVYPPLSMLLLYGLHALGGYSLLSWFGALCCAATVAFIFAAGGLRLEVGVLAVLAVPLIAARTAPRADMFSTLLTATMLFPLWRFYRGERCAPLWLAPLLMLAWVNLHVGFLAGLGLIALYLVLEVGSLAVRNQRPASQARMRRVWPWLALTAAATLVNPWGYGIYGAFVRQNRTMNGIGNFVGEWAGAHGRQVLGDLTMWRSPDSAFPWLLVAGAVCVACAVWLRCFGATAALLAAILLSWQHTRLQAVFAILVAVIGGTVLHDALRCLWTSLRPGERFARLPRIASLAVCLVAVTVAGVRIADLTSNRYYLAAGEISLFGPGESWWFPERAGDFVLREQLPGNVFESYNLGGFLGWKLGSSYPVYIDGREVPFAPPLFFRAQALESQPLDSAAWEQEAAQRSINTAVFSTARYLGLGAIPLKADCESRAWTPVYLDEVAVVFVRNREGNAALTERLKIDCASVPFVPPRTRNRALLYNFFANAASVCYVLGRDRDAAEAFDRAGRIFSNDPNLYLGIAQLLQANGRASAAEAAYLRSLKIRQTAPAWQALGRFYIGEKRYGEAATAIERSAELAFQPGERYCELAEIYLTMKQPGPAMKALNCAERKNPFGDQAGAAREQFLARIAALRVRATQQISAPNL